jgi:hypothetical protein
MGLVVIASHRGERRDEQAIRDMPFDDTDAGAVGGCVTRDVAAQRDRDVAVSPMPIEMALPGK